jgi:hypothetical protein
MLSNTSVITFPERTVTVGSLPPEYGNGARRPVIHIGAKLTETQFSVSGDLKRPGASDVDMGGQINGTLREALDAHAIEFTGKWTAAKLREVLDLWDEWHLNDMTAGCQHQREGVAASDDDTFVGVPWDARPIDVSKPTNTYGTHYEGQRQASWNMLAWVRRDEHPQGLLSFPCPVCGYKYGTAWLTREIPADVRQQLAEIFA